MKASQPGSELFTAVAIADSRVVHLICSLVGGERLSENFIFSLQMFGAYEKIWDSGTISESYYDDIGAVSLKSHIMATGCSGKKLVKSLLLN
jgi:hypothetical protein